MKSDSEITVTDQNQGQSLAIAGGSYRILISGEQTNGSYAIIEMVVPPGGGPNPHAHPGFQETFYVVDGEVEFKTEQGKHLAGKGSFITIPLGGGAHCFKNKTDQEAHLLCTVAPAGLDTFFREIGKPIVDGIVPPSAPLTEEEKLRMKTIGEKYGQVFYPPNFLD